MISTILSSILLLYILKISANNETNLIKGFRQPCSEFYSQAHCDEDDEDYPEHPSETGENCFPIAMDDCDRSLQLYCVAGLCEANCHPSKEDYDPTLGKCFRKLGTDCSSSDECGANAVCEGRQCRCPKKFSIDPETEKCSRSGEFGEHCDSEIICDFLADMMCLNNTCQCREPLSQFYHAKRKRCYLLIGEDCTNKGRSFQQCPDHSDCIRTFQNEFGGAIHGEDFGEIEIERYIGISGVDEEAKTFQCSCEKGYASTLDQKACLGIQGTSCNSLHRCNTERNFKCLRSGNCQCVRPKDQIFNFGKQRCLTQIGSLCNITKDVCVDWAECKPDADKGIHTCECISGFGPAFENEICLKDYGQKCSFDDIEGPMCNIYYGLECSNHTGICECKDPNQIYDVQMKVCRHSEVTRDRIAIEHDISDREYLFHLKHTGASGSNTRGLSFMAQVTFTSLVVILETRIIQN